MIDPSWLADVLAGLVLATAVYCAGRIVVSLTRGRRIELDTDLAHLLMGIGMAGMFVTRLAILDTATWSVVFALVAAWYLLRIAMETRGGTGAVASVRHHAGHLVSALAMLYMFLAVPGNAADASAQAGSSMGAMAPGMSMASGMGAHLPTLALLFALMLFGYAVLVADRIPLSVKVSVPTGGVASAVGGDDRHSGSGFSVGRCGLGLGRGPLLAPRGTAVCEVVMSVAMGVMLIAML